MVLRQVMATPFSESVADASFAELRALYEADDRLREPATLFNALLNRKKLRVHFLPLHLERGENKFVFPPSAELPLGLRFISARKLVALEA